MKKRWYLVAGGFLLAVAFVGSQFVPLRDGLLAVIRWTDQFGLVGAITFGGIYVVATVAMVPGAILTMGAGYVWGVVWGTVLISVASTIGAAVAFLVARFVARERVRSWVYDSDRSDRIRAVDRAVEKEGFKVVFLLRLVPVIPFNFLNYLLGLTGVSSGRYVAASWIGMLPGTVMYVYAGAVAGRLTEVAAGQAQISTYQYVMFAVGFLAVVTVTVMLTRRARRELAEISDQEEIALSGSEDAIRDGLK